MYSKPIFMRYCILDAVVYESPQCRRCRNARGTPMYEILQCVRYRNISDTMGYKRQQCIHNVRNDAIEDETHNGQTIPLDSHVSGGRASLGAAVNVAFADNLPCLFLPLSLSYSPSPSSSPPSFPPSPTLSLSLSLSVSLSLSLFVYQFLNARLLYTFWQHQACAFCAL